MEGPLASVQVSPETPRPRVPTSGPTETSALRLLCLPVRLLSVNISLFILHGLWVVPLPQPLFFFQFLLQPLLPAQLLQWQPIQGTIVFFISFTESSCFGER